MYTLANIREELRSKERTISDLVRFIHTRTDDNPNYSLLVGAGCSVTSGVRSATELIKVWKEEIASVEGKHPDEIEKESWYNSRNSYSSLFEKKYDLPRQRRMFVEQEVRDKIPSIGYAYLVKLVENNYFKTIFTTNFDDLLNEAFYQFSSRRPLICAHDSAINSITVTSKRPKIVKLHGDYLFDDIKSTLRETESLEDNIKNKFVEFAKDYGLIIVGYGGNDRSVIDVITYLLKGEDYFKHGIYWCLREDSEINDDLKKLLWKDRVYYVKIDGFDELFAELNNKLNKGELPVDNDFLNNKKKELLKKLTSNEFLKDSKCNILIEDFKKIEKNLERDVVQSFIKYIVEKESKEENKKNDFKRKGLESNLLTQEELFLAEIQSDFISENYLGALQSIESKLSLISPDSLFYKELIKRKARCLRFLKKKDDAICCYEELIRIDNINNADYYLILSKLYNGFEKKISILEQAIEEYKYNFDFYYQKSKLLYDKYESSLINDEKELGFSIEHIIELTNKSIEINPSIENNSWMLKFELIKEKFKLDKEAKNRELEKLVSIYEKQDAYHPNFIMKKVELMTIKDAQKTEIFKIIEESITNSSKLDYIKWNELTLIRQYSKYNELESLNKRFAYIETNYEVDNDYLLLKAELLLQKFDKLTEAINILENIKFKNLDIHKRLFKLYLYSNKIKEAEEIFTNYLSKDETVEYNLLSKKGDYSKIITSIDNKKEQGNDTNSIVNEVFYRLKNKEYKNAKNLAYKYLVRSSYKDLTLLINYTLAIKKESKLTTTEKDKVSEKIINSGSKDDMLLAAAYSILDDENNTYKHLKKAIEDDYEQKYHIQDWIIFENYLEKDRFQKLIYTDIN